VGHAACSGLEQQAGDEACAIDAELDGVPAGPYLDECHERGRRNFRQPKQCRHRPRGAERLQSLIQFGRVHLGEERGIKVG